MWCIILLILYVLFDLNYYLRAIFTVALITFSKRNLKLTDTTTTYGICTTQDIDLFLNHMNNARFLRELDFARYQWYGRTPFWSMLRSQGGSAVQGSSMIRYRKMIRLLRPFRIETKLVWWDEKSIFFEHKFITLLDGFVRAVAISRQAVIKVNLTNLMDQFDECRNKPVQPEEIGHWLDAIEVSSQRLRKEQ